MFGDSGDNDDDTKRKYSRRLLLLGGAQIAAFGALSARLFQLQVTDETRYALLADDNRVDIQTLAPVRGRIFDRRGELLAGNVQAFRVVAIPSVAPDLRRVLIDLARVIPLTDDDIDRLVKRARRQSPNTPLIIATDLTFERVAEINLHAPQLPGVRTEIDWRRTYLKGPAVSHVVGYVGSVDRYSLDDEAVLRLPGMKVGKSGIEAGLDKQLRGVGGTQRLEVDARGRMMRTLEESEPETGADVALSIDTELQRRVLERLSHEERASAVVISVETGEVVAMVSYPAYDPAEIVSGISKQSWQRILDAANKPILNRAISGQYPPGSTFKMVTALAGLEAGVVSGKDHVTCKGSYAFADQTYRCWKRGGHDRADLHKALRESCDVYFYDLARRLGITPIATMARRLGLGQIYRCGLTQQKAGLIPDANWKLGRMNASWLDGETILTGIGQGYVLATPLQLAVMTARIAAGKAVVPTLVRQSAASITTPFAALGIATANLDAVRAGMLAVVNEEGGTGLRARLEPDQPRVAGKTGTAQVRRTADDAGGDEMSQEHRDHALFVCYFPAERPKYAISVVVEHGGGGGATAAPLARDIVDLVLADDPMARPFTVPPAQAVHQHAGTAAVPGKGRS